jgi:4-amino-4-deoxy-L-arabinose transferase-like glycosyltransferase
MRRLLPDKGLGAVNDRPDEAGNRLRWLAVVFGVAMLWRGVAIGQVASASWFAFRIGDAAAYHEWAQEVARGHWLGERTFYQAPLYPYCLGVVYSLFGESRLVVVMLQTLLGAIACVLLCDAGWRSISKWTGVIAGLLLATHQPAIFSDLLIQKSSLNLFLVCGQLWIISRAMRDFGWKWLVFLGAVSGLLALNRENALLVAVILGAWVWFSDRTVRLKRSLLYLAGLMVVLAPVAVRNRIVGGEWHLTTSQFGPNLYIGNHAGATGTYSPLVTGGGDARFERRDAQARAEIASGRKLSDAEVSLYWTRRTLEEIRKHPKGWLRLMGLKWGLFWNAAELTDTEDVYTYAEQSIALRVPGRWLPFGALAVLATWGVWAGWRQFRIVRLLVVLVAAYAASVVLFYVVARYRMPVVPWLMLLGAVGLRHGLEWLTAASWGRRAGAIVATAGMIVLTFWPLVDIDRQRTATHLNFGAEWSDRGNWSEAIDEYLKVLAINPRFSEAHFNLGTAYAALGQLDLAAGSFKAALEVDPSFPRAALNLGNVAFDRGDLNEAERWFNKTVELDPREARAYNGLGMVFGLRNDWQKGAEAFEKAVELAPDFAPARQNLNAARARLRN